jgi:putative hydrolase of the HAD superfamily
MELFNGKHFKEQLAVMREIAVLVDGSHSKILKPQAEAYAAAVAAMGLPAARLLFVDDQMRNIVGAHQFGLQTQLFDLRDPEGSCRAVLTRLGLDPVATP